VVWQGSSVCSVLRGRHLRSRFVLEKLSEFAWMSYSTNSTILSSGLKSALDATSCVWPLDDSPYGRVCHTLKAAPTGQRCICGWPILVVCNSVGGIHPPKLSIER